MMRLIQLLACLMMVPALGIADQGVQILLPSDHVSTSVPNLHIVGRAFDSKVVVELNGTVVATPTVTDSIFHARVSMPFGLNHIVVRPVSGSESDSLPVARIEVLCGPRISRSYLPLYTPHEFHGLQPQNACLTCHLRDTATDEGKSDWDWCISCHESTGRSFKRHLANQEGDCTVCHKIANDMTRSLSGDYTDMNPCYGCHTDKIGQFAQDFIHGPVAGGSCTICHNPHGSNYEKNLRSPVPFLCMFCHTALDEVKARVQHKPFADGLCTKCHDPHSTGNRWVLVKSTGEVCLACHEGRLENHRHRYEVKPRNELEADLVLNQRGRLECLTCHSPHATDTEHLLKTDNDNPCVGCHPEHM